MNTVRCFCIEFFVAVLASSGLGCSERPNASPPDETLLPVQESANPIVVPSLDLPVKEGTMPLAYLIETTGGVRVVDTTTIRELGRLIAPGNSIVSIDESHGVSIAGTVCTPGPLSADHHYAIYFNSGGFTPEQEIRTATERTDPSILHRQEQPADRAHAGVTTGPSPHQ